MSSRNWSGSSFRDPSGHIFTENGVLYRSVAPTYAGHYSLLMSSGLYGTLVGRGQLVPHEEVDAPSIDEEAVHRVLRPERIPFISYPWEWSFSQLRDAALLTVDIAWKALEHGMVLKDASAFNVQFVGSRPVFIDTLSFETYVEGEPWVAYRQFCQHFLAPLELYARVGPSMAKLLKSDLDGIPLDLASRLLPRSTMLRPSTAMHIHAHARTQRKYSDSQGAATSRATVSKRSQFALLDSLRSAVKGCTWQPQGTEWGDYYDKTNYDDAAMASKLEAVERLLGRTSPSLVWDLGANTGRFSRLASERGIYTIAFDIDPAAVEKSYREGRSAKDPNLLPLVMDLMNPTPNLGWNLRERDSFLERGKPDVTLALALIHHLAIGQNVPLDRIAAFFSELTPSLIIEFVPKSDSQVRRMLASREDIFADYDKPGFERAFGRHFEFDETVSVKDTDRVLYSMRRRDA